MQHCGRLRELAEEHPRWGAPMLLWKLRQEGIMDNHKRVRRLYRLEGLAVRRRGRKRVAVARVEVLGATRPNEHWAMGFMRDTLSDGRAFRALTLVDAYTRECPGIEVDVSLGGARVVAVLERLRLTRGLPERITVDNGPEFRSKALDEWAHQHGVQLQFSRLGKPVDNTFIEAFKGFAAAEWHPPRFVLECSHFSVWVYGSPALARLTIQAQLQVLVAACHEKLDVPCVAVAELGKIAQGPHSRCLMLSLWEHARVLGRPADHHHLRPT